MHISWLAGFLVTRLRNFLSHGRDALQVCSRHNFAQLDMHLRHDLHFRRDFFVSISTSLASMTNKSDTPPLVISPSLVELAFADLGNLFQFSQTCQ